MKNEQKTGIQKSLVEVLKEVRSDKGKVEEIKKSISKYNILSGEISKIILNPESIREIPVAEIILIYVETYKVTKNEKINPKNLPIYNPEVKANFLNNKYNPNTQLTYMRIFEKSKESEEKKKKDLYELKLKDIESILFDLEPLTKSASHVNGRIISSYIDWCMDNLSINTTNELRKKEMNWFDKFVDKDVQLYMNESTLRKIEDDCVNYQDAVILRLLFEGVQGKKDLAEIRNIKYQDVNWVNNEVMLYDYDNSERLITLSDRAMFLMDKAFENRPYIKKNGNMVEHERVKSTTELVENDYLIRSSITKTDQANKPVDKMVVYRRIKTIDETNTLGIRYLTVKNIVRSGIIHKGKKIIEKSGTITKADYLSICKIYNISNWYPVKKYCNEDTIKKVYGDIKMNRDYAIV